MFEFFDLVLGYIETIWTFFTNFISTLVMALGFLATSLSFPSTLAVYMPPIIGVAMLITVAICVIKLLIGVIL